MKLIDTHAHLYADDFQDDIEQVVARAKAVGVDKVLLPNVDETTITALRTLTSEYPDFFLPMMGLHPTSVKSDWKQQLEIIYAQFDTLDFIAVGEIGIDLYWDRSLEKVQMEVFEEQLRWSIEKDLPVSIHSRNATYEVIQSINNVGRDKLRGVFHSFGGSNEELEAILFLPNFFVGINGVLTFKNSKLPDTLRLCPRERVILETDAPYLTPHPYRGKRNESAYMDLILRKLAEVWEIPSDEASYITSNNARILFSLGSDK